MDRWLAFIVALAAPSSVIIAAVITNSKLRVIHMLVNSRLTEALKKIDRLEQRLYETTGEPPTGESPRDGSGS